MPGIDASIPLGVKQPDQMQNLSSLLGVANGMQTLQQNQQKTQQGGIDLQERQGMQQFLSDPKNFTDEQGNLDPVRMQAGVSKYAPTTGFQYMQAAAHAHKAHTEATTALNSLTAENRTQIGNVLSALPPDAAPDLVHKTVDALNDQYKGRLTPLVSIFKGGYDNAVKAGGAQGAQAFVKQQARNVLPQTTQVDLNTPNGVTVSDGQTSRIVNVKPGVDGLPPGAAVPGTEVTQQLAPGQMENIEADSQGNRYIVTRTKAGAIVGTRPLQNAAPQAPGASAPPGPFALPAGESQKSMGDLQDQRTAAHSVANSAPQMHDINRSIISEVKKGTVDTGRYGAFWRDISSRFPGFKPEGATDYDILGKMLERSALTAAQGMGPHTNAGLEASIKANGSLAYTPGAIEKIAHLNDAIVSGSELYRDGLERAIGSSPNHVFAKREFDSAWAKVATPSVLRLKNAVDNGDKEEVEAISKEVGGRGSDGARKLHKQLTELMKLSGR